MANSSQELTSTIVIRGKVDASTAGLSEFFKSLSNVSINAKENAEQAAEAIKTSISDRLSNAADAVTALGSQINQISQPLINLGKESINLYVEFEDHMKYIQGLGGLTTAQMEEVEKAARSAGETTRYTASEAAQALEDNAVAGLSYKESIELLNTELIAAAAGNMDLTTASSQLLSALAITNTEFADATNFVDQWAKTAASSKSDMEGLGEAIERMGATMNYLADGSTEMFTIFGELGNLGAEGAEMGTYARNVLLSLVAPTDKSAQVMEALGYSVEEVEEALDGLDSGESAQLIERLGLQVYDEDTGKLRNVFDILADLNTALESMTSEERNKAMSTIFNKRTLGYAEGLMKVAASGEWRNLFQNIADADGYATQVADTRESGLGGTLRVLESQWEEVQLTIGDFLKGDVQKAAEGIGGIFEWFTSFDETTKSNILNVLEALAAAGPTLLAVGVGLKALSFATTPAGAIALATVALAGLYKAMQDVRDINFSENFGTAELDMDALKEKIAELESGYEESYKDANAFNQAAKTSLENYATMRSEFQSKLIQSAITGNALTETDLESLKSLGESMINAVYEGMGNTIAGDEEDWETAGLSDETLTQTMGALTGEYESTKATLTRLGNELFEALTGDFTEEQARAKIEAVLNELDAVAQEYAERQATDKANAEIVKAGWVSRDNAEEYFTELNESYEAAMKDYDERWAANLGTQKTYLDEGLITQAAYDEQVKAVKENRVTAAEPYQQAAYAAMEAVFSNSGVSDIYHDIMSVLKEEMGMEEFGKLHGTELGLVKETVEAMKPMAEILQDSGWMDVDFSSVLKGNSIINPFAMQTLKGYLQSQIAGNIEAIKSTGNQIFDNLGNLFTQPANKLFGLLGLGDSNFSANTTSSGLESTRGYLLNQLQSWNPFGDFMKNLGVMFDGDTVTPTNTIATASDTIATASETIAGSVNSMTGEFAKLSGGLSISLDVPGMMVGEDGRITITGNIAPLEADIEGVVDEEQTVTVGANTSKLNRQIDAATSKERTVTVKVNTVQTGGSNIGNTVNQMFANGGRATEASIFGEAGAEWAIPEQHTTRTADLLKAAAAASGFTWAELLASTGGLNGGANTTSVVFAPQINASGDTGGLKAALEDAQRKFFAQLKREQIIGARVGYSQ